MQIKFLKYHGTGNDFVMINQFDSPEYELSTSQIKYICDRRFGVGADGLILLRKDDDQDFKMVYFNSDGRQSSMCGNGGRCIVRFAHDSGFIGHKCSFLAIDGVHHGEILDDMVKIDMKNVDEFEKQDGVYIIDTGSPHYVFQSEEDLSIQTFKNRALSIRNSSRFIDVGVNVNTFRELSENHIKGITFERGVEDITWSCGTGVVAMAMSYVIGLGKSGRHKLRVDNLGGTLYVELLFGKNNFTQVYLIGPAKRVFEGVLTLNTNKS